jgi:hypothetical protein
VKTRFQAFTLKILQLVPLRFGTLVNLEECNVSGNQLKSLDALGACKRITELDASDNLLNDAELAHLKPLVRLDVLSLEGNALTSLDRMPCLEDLTELSLARNRLTSLGGCGGGRGGGDSLSLADKVGLYKLNPVDP